MKAALVGLALAALPPAAQAADAAHGEALYRRSCRFCHQIGDGAHNAVGPELNGVVGRKAASLAGFRYSKAMAASGAVWTPDRLKAFLHDPAAAVPGTAMTFAGFQADGDIADVIAYLKRFDASGHEAP